jgi:hypothetical protein
MIPNSAKPQPSSEKLEALPSQKPKNKPRVRTAKKAVAPGEVFGRLTVTGVSGQVVEASCSCGASWRGRRSNLVSGLTTSCGCRQREVRQTGCLKHGHKGNGKTSKVYRAWQSMKSRCYLNSPINHQYLARGIGVCDEWRNNFEVFAAHIGPPPSPTHSVDRIDNSRGYEPGNVRWATKKEQGNNKSNNTLLTAFGVTRTLPQWGGEVGLSVQVLRNRIKAGWPIEKVICRPVRVHRPYPPRNK